MINMRYIYLLLLVGIFILLPGIDAMAQCFPPQFTCCPPELGPGACGGACPTCTPVPLDGGLSALLVAGFAYGAKKIYGKPKA
jgi:hypothetical protein